MSHTIASAAIEAAWRLARSHGHHWAADAGAAALAYGRARRDAGTRHDARVPHEDTALEALRLAWLDERETRRYCAPRPPKTVEEAVALEHLPAGIFAGLGFALDHVTASGRLGWDVRPDGRTVEIEVHRPAGRCLGATIYLDRTGTPVRVEIEAGPRPAMERHVAALNGVMAALGIKPIDAANPLLADHDGRTPAMREVQALANRLSITRRA